MPYDGDLLAFGVVGTYGGETAAVWRSSDGRAWRRVEADSFAAGPADRLLQPNSSISAVAVRGRRLVALGQATSANPADGRFLLSTWTSVDGDQWERHDLPTDAPTPSGPTPAPSPMPSGIVATPTGFVAFANDDTDVQSGLRNRTLVFTSPDGVTWSRTAVGGLGEIGNSVFGAVMYRGHLVAYGGRGGNNGTPAAWVSNDNGTSWKTIPLSSQSTLPYGAVQQAVATPSGLLLIGFSTPGLTGTTRSGPGAPLILEGEWDTVAWRSGEGDDFTPLDTSGLNTTGFDTVTAVAATRGGAVLAMQRTEPAGHTTHVFGWSPKTGFVEEQAGDVATVSALIDYQGAFLAMADASRDFDPTQAVLNTVVWRAPHR